MFGCGSQIQNQVQNLNIRIPAVMSAEQGIIDGSAQPIPKQIPAWVKDCLSRKDTEHLHIQSASYPQYDLARLDWLSTNLSFRVRETGTPVTQTLIGRSLTGRIVGHIEIREPNTATLEAMHQFSKMLAESNDDLPHKPGASLPQLIWTKDPGDNTWTSSLVYVLLSHVQEKGPAQISVIFPYAPLDAETTKKMTENPQLLFRLYQQNVAGAFKESSLGRLGRELFAPSYSGIVSFHPEFLELIEWLDGSYTNVCYPIHK